MQVSVCSKYWLALLIFGVSCWMTWQEANGSWNALTPAKGIFPLQGSASVSAHPCQELGFAARGEQWENYSCAHSMGKHVDECWQSVVLMDDCLSSLDQVGIRKGIVFGLCRQVTRNTTFPLLLTIVF